MCCDENRLCVYKDAYAENGFIVKTTKFTFARVNKIGEKWCVWFYKSHTQKEYLKLREALAEVNAKFVAWYRGRY